MSLEAWNTVFAGATFAVIAATAISALIQLRHLRASNQLNAFLTLMEMWNSPELHRHIAYSHTALREKIKDPHFLEAMVAGATSRSEHPELMVADFWEQIGALMKYGLIEERWWLDLASAQILRAWGDIEPVIKALRRTGGPSAYENFEYAAVRARLWSDRAPKGTYPTGMPRMSELKAGDPQDRDKGAR